MKLYVYDMGYRGAFSVVAQSREEATELVLQQYIDEALCAGVDDDCWEEYDFSVVVRNYGDS